MPNPALPCCLGHWVLKCLAEDQRAQLRHPDSDATVAYRQDDEHHLWARVESDRHGEPLSDQEMYSLAEVFDALKIDDVEGYRAVIDGELIEL